MPKAPVPSPIPSSTPVLAVPILHELRISKDAEEWVRTLSPGIFQSYEDLQKTWNAPATQFTLTLVRDPQLRQVSEQILDSKLGTRLLGYEFGLILLLWIIRAWRLQKSQTWLRRIWTQAWLGAVYSLLAIFLVPFLVWGETYLIFLKQIFLAILRHFFT